MRRNLKTVPELAAESPFSEGQLRWLIFSAGSNGLAQADAVVRVGRRVYLDVDRFSDWIDAQNRSGTPSAAAA